MEQLNRIELKGSVGSVRIRQAGERNVASISLVTNFAYKDRDGEPVIESTWHNVCAWEGKGVMKLEEIRRGAPLHVIGRVRTHKYTGSDGQEKAVQEVLAYRLQALDTSDGQLQCEM